MGYTPSSVAGQLQLMAHISRWLVDHGLDGHDLTSAMMDEFLQARRAARYRQWLSAGHGAAAGSSSGSWDRPGLRACRADGAVEALLAAYPSYLIEERGLAASTALTVLLRLGLRVGEIAALELTDVDWRYGEILFAARAIVRHGCRCRPTPDKPWPAGCAEVGVGAPPRACSPHWSPGEVNCPPRACRRSCGGRRMSMSSGESGHPQTSWIRTSGEKFGQAGPTWQSPNLSTAPFPVREWRERAIIYFIVAVTNRRGWGHAAQAADLL